MARCLTARATARVCRPSATTRIAGGEVRSPLRACPSPTFSDFSFDLRAQIVATALLFTHAHHAAKYALVLLPSFQSSLFPPSFSPPPVAPRSPGADTCGVFVDVDVTFFWQWSGSGTVADRKARIVAHVEGLFADIDHIFRESSDLSFAVAGIKVRSRQGAHPV